MRQVYQVLKAKPLHRAESIHEKGCIVINHARQLVWKIRQMSLTDPMPRWGDLLKVDAVTVVNVRAATEAAAVPSLHS